MVRELKNHIDKKNVFFGVKQTLKNAESLEKAFVPLDCRDETMELLEKNKIAFESMDFSREEVTTQISLDFDCEVFGIKK